MAYQFYYDKYQWLDYWDTVDSSDVIESETLTSSTKEETSVTGQSQFYVSDPENYYSSYSVAVSYESHGYDSHVLRESGLSLKNNSSSANVNDLYYRKISDKINKYRITNVIADSYGQKNFYLLKLSEITLQPYTIYHHQSKGNLLETIVANDSTYPDDGYQSGYYWIKGSKPTVALTEISNKVVSENNDLTFAISATIEGTSVITYTATSLPAGATFNPTIKTFSWTPDYTQQGNYYVTFTASANGSSKSQTVNIQVINVERDPFLSLISNKTVEEGSLLEFDIAVNNPDGKPTTLTVTGLPSGASFDTGAGLFSWTPEYTQSGQYIVTFTVTFAGGFDSQSVTIIVGDYVPTLSPIGDKTVKENEELSFYVTSDMPTITILSAENLPSGAVFDSNSGLFSWKPSYYQSGSYQVTFKAGIEGSIDSEIITITVIEVHQAPVKVEPAPNYETNNRQPYFVVTVPQNDSIDTNLYHVRIRISKTINMGSIILDLESRSDSSIWELYDSVSGSWIPFPVEGVTANSKARVKPIGSLAFGFFYWDAATFEVDFGYSLNSSTSKINILIDTSKRYILNINSVDYEAYNLSVNESSNGEVGSIDFELPNQSGVTYQAINYGDKVLLVVNDLLGNSEQYQGVVKIKNPVGYSLIISAITGEGILSERIVKENYPKQDIGLSVKQMIDTYCQPLTSVNVNTNTGFVAEVPAKDKTPLRTLEELRRQYGFYYNVDDGWDTHLYMPEDIQHAVVTIAFGGGG